MSARPTRTSRTCECLTMPDANTDFTDSSSVADLVSSMPPDGTQPQPNPQQQQRTALYAQVQSDIAASAAGCNPYASSQHASSRSAGTASRQQKPSSSRTFRSTYAAPPNMNPTSIGNDNAYRRVVDASNARHRKARRTSALIGASTLIVCTALIGTIYAACGYVSNLPNAVAAGDVVAAGSGGSAANAHVIGASHTVPVTLSADGWSEGMGRFRFSVLLDGVLVSQVSLAPGETAQIPASSGESYELVVESIPNDVSTGYVYVYPSATDFDGNDDSISINIGRIRVDDDNAIASSLTYVDSDHRKSAEAYYDRLQDEYKVVTGEMAYSREDDKTLKEREKSYEVPEVKLDDDADSDSDDSTQSAQGEDSVNGEND